MEIMDIFSFSSGNLLGAGESLTEEVVSTLDDGELTGREIVNIASKMFERSGMLDVVILRVSDKFKMRKIGKLIALGQGIISLVKFSGVFSSNKDE